MVLGYVLEKGNIPNRKFLKCSSFSSYIYYGKCILYNLYFYTKKLPQMMEASYLWALWGSNPGPPGYEPGALTN